MDKLVIIDFPSKYTMGDVEEIKNIYPDILIFDDNFDGNLETFDLPDSIFYLDLGKKFSNSLDNVTLPKYLKKIKFGYGFNQSLEYTDLPETLEVLEFADYQCSLFSVKLPESLQEIIFEKFDRPLPFFLPPNIKKLFLGPIYDYSANMFLIPQTLKSLEISGSVNNKILLDNLPKSLKTLALISPNYDIDISYIELKKVSLIKYNCSSAKIILPENLIYLQINGNVYNEFFLNCLPENLEILEITDTLDFEMCNLPMFLKELYINTRYNKNNVIQSNLPFSLEKIQISDTYPYLYSITKLPFDCKLFNSHNQEIL